MLLIGSLTLSKMRYNETNFTIGQGNKTRRVKFLTFYNETMLNFTRGPAMPCLWTY